MKYTSPLRSILLLFSLILFFQSQLSANTFLVLNGNDSGLDSFRQAIEDSNALPGEDIIQFAPNITIFLSTVLPDLTDDVRILGNDATIFAPQLSGILTTFRSLYIEEIEFRDAVKSIFGGAIAMRGSSVSSTIKDCRFINNRSSSLGGAIYSSSGIGTLHIENCVLSVNVGAIGGAISHLGSHLNLTNVEFYDNGAAFGHAIQLLKNQMIITGDYFAAPMDEIAMESGLGGNPEVILAPGFSMLPGSELHIRKI